MSGAVARLRRMARLVPCLLVLALAGCGYVSNRLGDFADVFVLEVTVGPGLDVHAQATGLVGTGFGSSSQWGPMMHGRYVGTGARRSGGIILFSHTEIEEDLMVPLRGDEPYEAPSRGWAVICWPPSRPFRTKGERRSLLNVEVGASAIVGAHVGVSPIELVDFLLGFAMVDICSDDPSRTSPEAGGSSAVPGPEAGGAQ